MKKIKPTRTALLELLTLHKMVGTSRVLLESVPFETRFAWDQATEAYVRDLEATIEGLEAQAFTVMDELTGGEGE